MGFDVKNTTFFGLLDLVFPTICRGCGRLGSLLCERCKKYNIEAMPKICSRCRKSIKECSCEVPVYAAMYREGVVYKIVEEYKYRSVREAAGVLADFLAAVVPEEIKMAKVVPLPTVTKHIRERGFDHMLLVAKRLVKERAGFIVYRALERRKQTVQVGADKEVRKRQAKEAYEARERLNADDTYVLIDDVWTTGASMEAAIKVMQAAGAKKIVAAVILTPR